MPLTRTDLKQIIRDNKGGAYHSEYGPTLIAGKRVWEVWVQPDGVFENRFIVESNNSGDYFDSFQTFAPSLDAEIRNRQSDSIVTNADIHLKKFKAYIAATVFVIAVFSVVYMAFTKGDSNLVTGLLGLVASGGAYFFGKWTPA